MKGIIGAIVGDIVGSLHESFNAGPENGNEMIDINIINEFHSKYEGKDS